MSEQEMTYKEICAIEPRLTGLDALAKKAGQIDGLLDAKHNTTANYAVGIRRLSSDFFRL